MPTTLTAQRGLEFLHRRLLDPHDLSTPARCIVTAVRNERIYYRQTSGGKSEFTTLERWPLIAAPVPPKTETPSAAIH